MKKFKIGKIIVGENTPPLVIAEIGINHNGSLELCKKLIDLCKLSGCNYAKIQKRDPDLCVPESQKTKLRDTPWGTMTYLD